MKPCRKLTFSGKEDCFLPLVVRITVAYNPKLIIIMITAGMIDKYRTQSFLIQHLVNKDYVRSLHAKL